MAMHAPGGAGTEPYVFVTVGTTLFDALVAAVFTPAFAEGVRAAWGVNRVVVQVGRGAAPAAALLGGDDAAAGTAGPWLFEVAGVRFEAYRLKPSIHDDLTGATAVVSHAGAGSMFEAIRARRPLCVVINTALADNHQVELAGAMEAAGLCVHCLPEDVADTLRSRRTDMLRGAATTAGLPPVDGTAFRAGVAAVVGPWT